MEGNLHFKIDWASLILGRKFTIVLCFTFVFEGNFQVKAPGGGRGGAYILRGYLTGGILHLLTSFGGLKCGGAYTFQNFTVFKDIL